MKKTIAIFLICACHDVSFSQLGGEATYQFLNLISSPRQAAMGGKVLTNVDYDVTKVYIIQQRSMYPWIINLL